MADIIDEINEEIKQERMKALFAKYGKVVLGFAAAVVGIVVAIQGYGIYQGSVRAKAATAYFNALGESEIGNALADASSDLSGGYQMLAKFVTAAELVSQSNQSEAYDVYAALAGEANLSEVYRHFAAMQAVINAPEDIATDELAALVGPIADKPGPTQGLALELMADLALRDGDINAAKENLTKISELQDIPNGLRQRAATLALVLESKE